MSKVALITGITGQDGSYLAELLLSKGYEVHGLVRRVALEDETHRLWRIRNILDDLILHAGSLESYASLFKIISKIKPNEVYHLAAQSYVGYSFEDEFSTLNININGTHYLLSAVKEFVGSDLKFYFAGSSEMFGKVLETPQSEKTPFNPRSSYGISKVTGYHLTKNYREAYKLHASSGILFNHESPRRGFEFVTRKISFGVSRIKKGLQKKLKLGNLKAKRDWGHAKDYVEAMWLMLQQKKPEDFVISTNKSYSVKDFVNEAAKNLGFKIKWVNKGKHEKGINLANNKVIIKVNPKFYRPSEVFILKGNYSKALKKLKWYPKTKFKKLVKIMVLEDLKRASK